MDKVNVRIPFLEIGIPNKNGRIYDNSDIAIKKPVRMIQYDHEVKDYSDECDRNDDNLNNPCFDCTRFVFPLGCMVDEV